MALYGYGGLPDRAFVGFERELDDGAWKEIATTKYETDAKESAAALLKAPQPVVWKLRLRFGIGAVLTALGAGSLVKLDEAWDATQRRLFHRIAVGMNAEDRAERDAADRLAAGLLLGTGVAQTNLDYDGEVDFGRKQVALTTDKGAKEKKGSLATEAKKLKLADILSEVEAKTEALAKALNRGVGEKRKSPSRQMRDAIAECAGAFNAVHDELVWFISRTPNGAERDGLEALLSPLDALLSRNTVVAAAASEAEPAATPETPENPEAKPS